MTARSIPPPETAPHEGLPGPDAASFDDPYRSLVESARDYIFVLDPTCRVRYVNPFAVRAVGRALTDLVGRRLDEVFPAEIAARQTANVARVIETGKPLGVRAPSRVGDQVLWLDTILSPVHAADGSLTAVAGLSRDVTAEVEAREAARSSEERYHRILASTFDIILIHDGGVIVDANEGAARFFGCASPAMLVGRSALDVVHPDDLPSLERRMRTQSAGTWVGRLLRPDGRVARVEIATSAYEEGGRSLRIAAARDITDRHLLEQERLKAEKIDSLGVLAGGIAHDFNNLLAGFLGHLEVIRHLAAQRPDILDHVETASRAVDRATALTRQLLAFARGGAPVIRPSAIEGTLHDAVTFALRGANVEGRVHVPPDLWPAAVDLGQVAQVIHNLVLNASQAMPGGGLVTVRATNEDVGSDIVPGMQAGRYIRIDVEDHGGGIRPDVLPRIFDPYFTTRAGGTGLGLATTYIVVRNHHGGITVDTRLGRGTTFHVYLPASDVGSAIPPGRPPTRTRRPAHVLVMDDDTTVRDMLGDVLHLLGCRCEAAERGEVAVEKYRAALARGQPFDVVVLDLTVPGGLGGLDTLVALRGLDPGVRAIASSGYSDDAVLAQPALYGFQTVLTKPYRLEDVADALDRALGS